MTAATGRSPILRATYIALAVATIAAATAGLHLTFLTHETRTTFAWQIKNPMTAAFFGAAYVTAGIAVTAAFGFFKHPVLGVGQITCMSEPVRQCVSQTARELGR